MYKLIDTFNNVLLSKHRTLRNAIIAKAKHSDAVKKANGQNSYLTYDIIDEKGVISENEFYREESDCFNSGLI
jgi:hypothetical protein